MRESRCAQARATALAAARAAIYNGDRPLSFPRTLHGSRRYSRPRRRRRRLPGRLPLHPGRHQPHVRPRARGRGPPGRPRRQPGDDDRRQRLSVARRARDAVLRAARPDRFERRRDRHRLVCQPAKPDRAGQGHRHDPRPRPARRRAARRRRARRRMQSGQWVDAPVHAATVQRLEDIILTRARDLRRAAIAG